MIKKNNCRLLINLSQKKGTLLVEILLTIALFSIVSMTIASLLLLSSVMTRTNDAHARLNDGAMKILNFIGREIRETSATTRLVVTNGATDTVRFQIPVDDGAGFVVDPFEAGVKWGAYDQIGQSEQDTGDDPVDRWIRYSVPIGTKQLVRDVLDAGLNADLNLRTVVGNNIEGFDATLNGDDSVTISVTLEADDAVGQSGTTRTIDADFSYNVFLRNAAN